MQDKIKNQFKNRTGYKGMEMSLPMMLMPDSEISLFKHEIKCKSKD
jgi:hypothetical protein